MATEQDDSPQELARLAYIYGFPIVDNYRILYSYFVDEGGPAYKGPFNTLVNVPRVYTPAETAVQTPNSDTPYSFAGLDLRASPVVVTVPAIADVGGDSSNDNSNDNSNNSNKNKKRYWSAQLIDAYTHNAHYLGTRTTGNGGGKYLLVGPRWEEQRQKLKEKRKQLGEAEELEPSSSFDAVLRFETELALVLFRTQLFSPEDLPNVAAVQSGYGVEPLDKEAAAAAAAAAPSSPSSLPRPRGDWPKPLSPEQQRTSLEFFDVLDFALRFCRPPPPTQQEMRFRARLSSVLGLGGGGGGGPEKPPFKSSSLSPELASALSEGTRRAWESFAELKARVDAGELQSGDCFGTREALFGAAADGNGGNAADDAAFERAISKRMLAAVVGIYGNTKEEAIYPAYFVDSTGQKLDGSKNSYTLTFASSSSSSSSSDAASKGKKSKGGGLPPVNAFWSATMYRLPESLLYANEIDRYLINSAMLPTLARDDDTEGDSGDGGNSITIDISHAPPAVDDDDDKKKRGRSNWLPAPAGPFAVFLRLYWPKKEALNGEWVRPELVAKPLGA